MAIVDTPSMKITKHILYKYMRWNLKAFENSGLKIEDIKIKKKQQQQQQRNKTKQSKKNCGALLISCVNLIQSTHFLFNVSFAFIDRKFFQTTVICFKKEPAGWIVM